jgi:iron complex transport system ATP-binding protein
MIHRIDISGLVLGFGSKKLAEVNHDFSGNKLIAIKGRNGAGKTTLLKTICGLIPIQTGKITINGETISMLSPQQLAKKVAVVFTQRPVVSGLTVDTVLEMGQLYSPHSPSQRSDERQTLAIQFGISHLSQTSIETLSDGEFQKMMIARALLQDTPVILLDEPTAFLDYVAKEEIMQLLKESTHTSKKLILFSSHDLELAGRYADEIFDFDLIVASSKIA